MKSSGFNRHMRNVALELPRDIGHHLVSQRPIADSSTQVDRLYRSQIFFLAKRTVD